MSEVLIVGGLTVDRFADGSTAPGGSVLHSGRAVVAETATLTTLTVAGNEPPAREGLAQLSAFGELTTQAAPSTTTYRHAERDGVRRLILEARTEPIRPAMLERLASPITATLVGPIADEITPSLCDELRRTIRPRLTVLLVQGWLRRLVVGEDVTPIPLDELDGNQRGVIADADAIVVSTDDLVESPGNPFAQAAALRTVAGAKPMLVLTLGTNGYLLDDPSRDRLVASVPRRVVDGVPTVGAGDIFGASMAVNLARGHDAAQAAALAAERVIGMLEARRA